jgi:uncharacterized membrane protein
MNKLKFILELHDKLSFLSADDIEKSVEYYSEIIDDYVEDGLSEDDAVAALGDVDTIVSSILAETPMTHIIKQRIKPRRRLGALEIILIVLGSPIWLSLGAAFLAVAISIYVSLWSVIISLWATNISLAACFLGGIVAGITFMALGHTPSALFILGAALVCAGLAIFMFFGCKAATKGIVRLTKSVTPGFKNLFVKRGA